ncbi:WLM-domain-containing protein [Xylariaceae sp. FL1651]|nr:WLM-domain-containing protein [Xylariaceae sp. FL1651]
MPEIDPLILSYSHLANLPRAAEALHTLKRVASLVKPLMRARGWKVQQLTEFLPNEPNLLGLNAGSGQRICLRLRYHGDSNQFLPLEAVIDTMLHELSHNVHGPHDEKFYALWNQLRDEHASLTLKGYTGEGFLSEGRRLGGRRLPIEEARRIARVAAKQRRALQSGSGQRLGGTLPRPGQDIRNVIADAVEQRNRTLQGCANDNQTQDEIVEIADTATRNGFKTQAEEDAANDAAIAQALWELVQEDEKAKTGDAYVPLGATSNANRDNPILNGKGKGLATAAQSPTARNDTQQDQRIYGTWTCDTCTLNNPASYLCCDACGKERTERSTKRPRTVIDLTKPDRPGTSKPTSRAASSTATATSTQARQAPPKLAAPVSQNWTCHFCGRVRDKQWWSCDLCGSIKLASN